jgi:hypothetical protein
MLTVTTDPSQRPQIEKLLHEEEAKLKNTTTIKSRPAPARQLNHALIARQLGEVCRNRWLPDRIASVFLLLALFGKQIDYMLSV